MHQIWFKLLPFRFLGPRPIIPALPSFSSSNTKFLSVDYLLLVVTPKSPGDDGFLVCHYFIDFRHLQFFCRVCLASPTIWFYLSSNHCALSAKNVQSNNPNIKHNIKQWAGIDFKQTASNSKDSTRDCHRHNNIQQPSPQPKQQLEDI